MELTSQYTKEIKILTEESNQNSQKVSDLEEQLLKTQNQYEVKLLGLEEELESERRAYENRFEIIKKKHDELESELAEI